MKLDLFGGMTVDPSRAALSPRDQQVAIRAEVEATTVARMRRELVPAAEVSDCLARAFGLLRREMMDIATSKDRRRIVTLRRIV